MPDPQSGFVPSPCATCGHDVRDHVYHEGKCRGGFICSVDCQAFAGQALSAGDSTAPPSAASTRSTAMEVIAFAICATTHGDIEAAGWPIQKACLDAASHALDLLEAHGWGPYFAGEDDQIPF